MMTSRERFLTALNGGQPDRVPIHEHLFSPNLQQYILGRKTPIIDGATQVELTKKLGIDSVWIPINGFCGTEEVAHQENEIYKDEWGVTYQKSGWPIMAQLDTPIKSVEDWENYKMPDVNTSYRTKFIKEAVAVNNGEVAIVLGILGPFTMLSWYLVDFMNLSLFMYSEPELLHKINDAYEKWIIEAVALAVKDSEGAIDAVQISDDWGGTNNLLMSPAHFREFIIPSLKRIVEGIKEMGIPVILHNDGKIWDLLDDIADCGVVGLHPIERAATMDLVKVKKQLSGRVCPIGNVNNKITMSVGTLDEVELETRECIEAGAPGGGYMISTDHSIHDGIPIENVFKFIETVHKYGEYK